MKGAPSKPNIFIGSSSASKFIAESLKDLLKDVANCKVWDEAFPLSKHTLESLINEFNSVDFGIFILSDDDTATIKGNQFKITRDNVLFESGMSIGGLGRDRTFLVVPITEPGYHLATDLGGLTIASYQKADLKISKEHAMQKSVEQIIAAIATSRWQQLNLTIDVRIIIDDRSNTHYKMKLMMGFYNNEKFPITVQSINFKLSDFLLDDGRRKNTETVPEFLHHSEVDPAKDVRVPVITIEPNSYTNCYVPIDPVSAVTVLNKSFGNRFCGEFEIKCILHTQKAEGYLYKLQIHSEKIVNQTQIEFQQSNLIGLWENNWGTGQEKVRITKDMLYYIDNRPDADYMVAHFEYDNTKGRLSFVKDPMRGKPKYTNRLTVVSNDLLLGEEYRDDKYLHQIRYTRIK